MPQEILQNIFDLEKIKNNKIITTNLESIKLTNSKISFDGINNIVFFENNVILNNTSINIKGNNNIIFFSSSNKPYYTSIDIYNNSVIYFGKNNYFNGKLNIILSEAQNIICGNDCLFSYGITIRTSDAHPIYDNNSGLRINKPSSVLIGDHVWICQNASIFKGSKIGSGSIIGSMTFLSGKNIGSNESWGGNPARKIKEGVFFLNNCVHNLNSCSCEKFDTAIEIGYKYIYQRDENTINFLDFDTLLKNEHDLNKKIDLLKNLNTNIEKNRFFV